MRRRLPARAAAPGDHLPLRPGQPQVRAAGAHGIDIEGFAGAHISVDTAPIAAQALREDQVVETAGDMRGTVPPEYAALVPEPMRLVVRRRWSRPVGRSA